MKMVEKSDHEKIKEEISKLQEKYPDYVVIICKKETTVEQIMRAAR